MPRKGDHVSHKMLNTNLNPYMGSPESTIRFDRDLDRSNSMTLLFLTFVSKKVTSENSNKKKVTSMWSEAEKNGTVPCKH